jgi:type IV pilus assembly protein PilB
MSKVGKKLGEILVEDGLITAAQLEEALAYQKEHGGLIGQILIDKKAVTEDDLVGALGKQFRVPYIPLKNYLVNHDMAGSLTADFCHEHLLVPFDGDAKRISVAVSDPADERTIEKIRALTQKKPQVFIARISDIRNVIYAFYHERT